ncbi:MAG: hypothetical protein M3O09_10235 [Acidobacteriota bacterium]|nr:hypothetical protein [Acidobacteriota bacterium]
MMTRRGALIAISAAALGAVPLSSALVRLLRSRLAEPQESATGTQLKDAAKEAADERLRQDLARLAPNAYSEEGVPVFLACEDLVSKEDVVTKTDRDKTSQKSSATLIAFNISLASKFRKTADAWQRIHPDATGKDVAKVIEVLADRDFSSGGTEQKQ